MEKRSKLWCNTHQRYAALCKIRGGILLPCKVVDISNLIEIEDQMEVKITIDVNFGEQGYSHVVKVNQEALDRVRFNFNPSGLQEVSNLKALAAAFITECMNNSKPHSGREFNIAKTEMQTASMYAVAATTSKPKEEPSQNGQEQKVQGN